MRDGYEKHRHAGGEGRRGSAASVPVYAFTHTHACASLRSLQVLKKSGTYVHYMADLGFGQMLVG